MVSQALEQLTAVATALERNSQGLWRHLWRRGPETKQCWGSGQRGVLAVREAQCCRKDQALGLAEVPEALGLAEVPEPLGAWVS